MRLIDREHPKCNGDAQTCWAVLSRGKASIKGTRCTWPILLGCVIGSCGGADSLTAPRPSSTPAFTVGSDTITRTESFTGAAGALSGSWTQQSSSGTLNRNGIGAGIGSVNMLCVPRIGPPVQGVPEITDSADHPLKR